VHSRAVYADTYYKFNPDIFDYQTMSATGPTGPTGCTGPTGSSGDPVSVLSYMFQIPLNTIETVPRILCSYNQLLATGTQRWVYFTPFRSMTVSNITTCTTTSGSGLTVSRLGLYTVDAATGDVTLVASTANDTSLLTTSQTLYTKSLTVPYSIVAGTQYAVGVLCVGTVVPGLASGSAAGSLVGLFSALPRLAGYLAGQSDLATSAAASGMGTVNEAYKWARVS
jgi:hypothetical protein